MAHCIERSKASIGAWHYSIAGIEKRASACIAEAYESNFCKAKAILIIYVPYIKCKNIDKQKAKALCGDEADGAGLKSMRNICGKLHQ